jgi:hypothetical protein
LWVDGRVFPRRTDNEESTILGEFDRTLGPQGFDLSDPFRQNRTEGSTDCIRFAPELLTQSTGGEDWYVGGLTIQRPALPNDPNVKVQNPWSVRQGRDDLPLHRNSMVVNLPVERLAESNGVLLGVIRGRGVVMSVEPKLNPIEEVETGPVGDMVSARLVFGAEEDGGGKDPPESLHDAAVVTAVLGQAEEIQDLSRALEADGTGLLLHGERGDPDGNEAVLTERKTEARVTGDIEEELAIASGVSELVFWWAAQGDTTKDERSGMVGKFLRAVLSRLTDEADGFELPEPEPGEAKGGQNSGKGSGQRSRKGPGALGRPSAEMRVTVRKLCQKSMRLMGKGFHFERKQMSPNWCKPMEEKGMSGRSGKRTVCCHA